MAALPTNSTPELIEAWACAAVLGHFDEAALAALLNASAQSALEQLLATAAVSYDGQRYSAQYSEHPLEHAPARRAALHTRAARYYYERMQQPGERAAAERAYVEHMVQSCELLLRVDPAALHAHLAAVPIEQLSSMADRHLLRYYSGLGAGLADQLSEARALFTALLQEPELDALVRGRALNSGGLFAQMQGDYQQALDDYTASLSIWKQLGLRMREANALHNMGILRYELHDLEAAEAHFLASSRIYRELGDQHHLAMSSNELGLIYRNAGRWEQAQAVLEDAATLFEHEQAENSLGIVLGNLGEVALARGQYATAQSLLERSLSLMDSQVYAVDNRMNLGLLAQATDQDQAALEHYQSAGNLAEQLGRRDMLALITYREGHALQRLGQLAAAGERYEQAMATIEAVREPLHDQSLLISLMGRWQLVYEAALLLALETDNHEAAFLIAERARARAFADQLAQHGAQERSPATAITLREVQAALSPATGILSFFCTGLRGPETRLLEAMPPEASGLRVCMTAPVALIGMLVTQHGLKIFRAVLDPNMLQGAAGRNDGTRFLAPAILRRLYTALITPVAWELQQLEHLRIIPHGPLHQLSFAALLDVDNKALLNSLHIAYAPSVTVLLRTLARRTAIPEKNCLALGYAGLDSSLAHTQAEAQIIANILSGEYWPGQEGTRAAFLRVAGQYRYLHLACHGEFNLDDPLDSWLELGPHEQLNANDMLHAPALSADLVTLSACRSGISRVLRGDEPMGLARGFLGAGARAVLVTLWRVEDSSARLLMTRFYTELKRDGARVSEALQAAQQFVCGLSRAEAQKLLGQEVPTEGEYPFAEAYFWAAYMLIGAEI